MGTLTILQSRSNWELDYHASTADKKASHENIHRIYLDIETNVQLTPFLVQKKSNMSLFLCLSHKI